ncbi:hypothetical protein MKY59_15640 [Paenibacillus sp. FSL W8-0426]|uniref:hypothetical protein n=1 Tax=Paenibacillus sp. FSL W8-0426 TaxID=2921714 RepID=UPI0030DCB8BF
MDEDARLTTRSNADSQDDSDSASTLHNRSRAVEAATILPPSAEQEVLFSNQPAHLWKRRRQELLQWTERDKTTVSPKRTTLWNGIEVDFELVSALDLMSQKGMLTEYSCAGVSPLDEPVDHSLYAYVTLVQNGAADQFVEFAMNRMRNRLLVTLDQLTGRYDLSSFFIGHNRSFCWWMQHCAARFEIRNE